jgi:hypothetical protein
MIDDRNRCTPDVGPVNLTGSSGLTAAVEHERFVMDSSKRRYPRRAWSASACLAASNECRPTSRMDQRQDSVLDIQRLAFAPGQYPG